MIVGHRLFPLICSLLLEQAHGLQSLSQPAAATHGFFVVNDSGDVSQPTQTDSRTGHSVAVSIGRRGETEVTPRPRTAAVHSWEAPTRAVMSRRLSRRVMASLMEQEAAAATLMRKEVAAAQDRKAKTRDAAPIIVVALLFIVVLLLALTLKELSQPGSLGALFSGLSEQLDIAGDVTGDQQSESEGDGWDNAEDVSLKELISSQMPMINDAANFREARELLKEMGGAQALREELVNLGVVDDATEELTTGSSPFNIFACMAAGKKNQEDMEEEQAALGEYRKRFLVCKNLKERDEMWNSQKDNEIRIASMSQKHRMLTTKDLHWQWFNPLVFGLIPRREGGAGMRGAVEELEAIKAAALQYAKSVGGYSDDVGIYLNPYGHSEVNALFVHILDMSKLGPSFKLHRHKNCPIDAILEVLREEASISESYGRQSVNAGVLSIRAELARRSPSINSSATFRQARYFLEKLGGAKAVKKELVCAGYVDQTSHMLTTGDDPFNVFARFSAGVEKQDGMDKEQAALGKYQSKYLICCNKKENDMHWNSKDPEWIKKASMSRRHRMLTTKDLHWQWFNPLVFGNVPADDGGVGKGKAIEELEEMKAAAYEYAKKIGGWSDDIGLFFSCYGHSQVNSLFLHILDMTTLGPGFKHHRGKNCSIDAILDVLIEEAVQEEEDDDAVFDNKEEKSVKAEIAKQYPAINNATTFRKARALMQEMGGANLVRDELIATGSVDPATSQLTTGERPFNFFARMGSGVMKQDGMELEQAALGEYQNRYLICRNREESDKNWNSSDPKTLPSASMCRRHRILTRKDLHWQWFNPLVFGLVLPSEGGVDISAAVEELESMRSAALQYAKNVGGWSDSVYICMNCYGLSEVNAFFVHILDMSEPGPGWRYQNYKTLKVETIIEVLKEELRRFSVKEPIAIAHLEQDANDNETANAGQTASVQKASDKTDGEQAASEKEPVNAGQEASVQQSADVADGVQATKKKGSAVSFSASTQLPMDSTVVSQFRDITDGE